MSRPILDVNPPPSTLLELKGYGSYRNIKKESDGTYYSPYSLLASDIRFALKGKKFRTPAIKAARNRISRHLGTKMYSNFLKETDHVTSARFGPKRWYDPQSPQDINRQVIDRVRPELLEYVVERGGKQAEQRLWKLLNDLSIASRISISRSKLHPPVIMVKDNITKIESNLMDVGYGASQTIPIIAACLIDRKGPVFIEQPEIHLHPKAQTVIADLLCSTSNKRQVIVETHSAHMINRARIQVLKGNLDHREVIVNFVYRNEKGSHVKTIPILENGEFGAEWPEGFFDERFQDTKTLLKLRSKK